MTLANRHRSTQPRTDVESEADDDEDPIPTAQAPEERAVGADVEQGAYANTTPTSGMIKPRKARCTGFVKIKISTDGTLETNPTPGASEHVRLPPPGGPPGKPVDTDHDSG